MLPEDLSGDAVLVFRNTDCTNKFQLKQQGNLPMIDEKKTSDLIETSLICLLSAGVAIGAFLLVWLIAVLT